MSLMKRYLENLSVEMGYGGVITAEVIAEAERRERETRNANDKSRS